MRLSPTTILIVALFIAVGLLSTCNGCKQKTIDSLKLQLSECKGSSNNVKVVYKTDTVHDAVSFFDHAPIPYKTDRPSIKYQDWICDFPNKSILGADSGFLWDKVPDTLKIYIDTLVSRYYTTNYYSKKFNYKYGTITTHDTVFNNNLIGNGLDINLSTPITTRTIYQPTHKAVLYLGLDAFGNRNGLNGAGVSLMYQSPRSLNYLVGAYLDKSALNYRASVLFPLTKK